MNEIAGSASHYRIVIEAPPEKVWAVLTKKGEVLPFFFNNVLHTTTLAPGAPVRMRSPNGRNTGVVGDVLEFDPPRKYSHTFRFTHLNDPPCVVIYQLKPVEGGTEFTLTIENAPPGSKTEKSMNSGAKMIANSLKHYVETGKPNMVSRMIGVVNFFMGPFTPKACRSENWPLDRKIQ